MVVSARFRGWTDEAIEFYEGLVADNTKTYWEANKEVYDTAVRAPMEAFLRQVEPEFGAGKIFRPYRDVRFSADKTPYKTAIAAVATRDDQVFYVQFSADGLFAGTGYYHMARDQLARYRAAVDDAETGEELESIVEEIERGGYDIAGEQLRTAPRGFASDHTRIRLLRHKGLVMSKGWEPAAWLATAKAADRVIKTWRTGEPLNAWLAKHVGPSTEPAGRR